MSAAIICGALIQLASLHQASGLESFTPGAGLECQAGPVVAAAGVYRNSHALTSHYAAAGVLPISLGPVRLGAVLGAVDGYPVRDGGAMPLAAAVLSADLGGVSVQAFVTPHHGASHAAVMVGVFVPVGE